MANGGERQSTTNREPARAAIGGLDGLSHRPRLVGASLHVVTLAAFVIGQPILDFLARQAEFFAARRSEPIDVLLLSTGLLLLLPATLVSLHWLCARLSPLLGNSCHGALMVVLFGLLSLLMVRRVPGLSAAGAVVVALVLTVALTGVYYGVHAFRQLLSVLAPSALLFLLLFLLNGDIRRIVFPEAHILTPSGHTVRKTPIVMVVFDELPLSALVTAAGEIDGINFPGFKELAEGSVWFRNATTVAPVTNYAIPALLAGVFPAAARIPIDSAYPQNLFTVLAGSHDLHVHESATRLCPPSLCAGSQTAERLPARLESLLRDTTLVYLHLLLPPSLSSSLPPISNRWSDFLGDSEAGLASTSTAIAEGAKEAISTEAILAELRKDRLALFQAFIDRIRLRSSSRASLHFMHVLLPHTPWRYYPTGKVYTEDRVVIVPGLGAAQNEWTSDEWLVNQGYQRFLLQVRMVDRMIGALLTHLRAEDMYDSSLLIITADHGASFRPGDAFRRLTTSNLPDIVPIPLFMKLPGQSAGRIDDRNLELVDVFPTIAELLDVELQNPTDGHAVLTAEGEDNGRERSQKTVYDIYSRWRNDSYTLPARPRLVTESVERKYRIFGEPSSESFFRFGELAPLIGQEVATLRRDPARAEVSVATDPLFDAVDVSGGFIPGFVKGSVETIGNAAEKEIQLAIALNGIVAATTRTYYQSGTQLFTSLLPEDAFVAGKNELEIYEVTRADGFRLKKLQRSRGRACHLERSEGGQERIVFQNGDTIRVQPGAVRGYLDFAEKLGRTVKLSGWAIDGNLEGVTESMIVVVDNKCVFAGRHSGTYRPDMERHYGLPRGGYELKILADWLDGRDESAVRVFGASRGLASELAYHKDGRYPWSADRE